MVSQADRRNGARLVLDTLASEGVDVVFGYPGGAIMPLYDALYDHPVRHILVRHEAAAAFAAGGYARTSGKVGVCIATSGPGATNLVTGILDAMMDSVPVVAFTGQVRTTLMGMDAFQEADVAAITQVITKRNIVVRGIEEIVPAIRAAFRLARGPRMGPVLVDLPQDVLKAFETAEPGAPPATVAPSSALPRADAEAIRQTVALLQGAKRPVAIVGGGARGADAVEEFRELSRLLGLPHTATINGLGCAAPGDPAFLGMVGMHGWKAANLAVARSDVLLALGIRFDDRVTGRIDRFAPHATIVHADIDAAEFGKIVPANVSLHGDLKATLADLNAALRSANISPFREWTARVKEAGGELPRDPARDGHLRATDVIDALVALAPADAIVATDVGQHQMWAAQRVRPSHPRNFLTSAGLGAMGFGFPAAIGAKVAYRDRTVVAIVGDGGFQMSLPELATIRRYGLAVKILLIDNRNLGMVRQWQQLFHDERYSATNLSDNPDFCAIARAYEIETDFVDASALLEQAVQRFLCSPRATLLHCACYPRENVWPMIPPGSGVEEALEMAGA